MDRPTTVKTRKGNRIYRHPYRRGGTVVHAENYTYRVKRDGRPYYFNVGRDQKQARTTADEIAAFLAVKSNTIEAAIARFSPDKIDRPEATTAKVPSIGEFIARYKEVTAHLRPMTVRDNCYALRRVAAHIKGLPVNHKTLKKDALASWKKSVDGLPLNQVTSHRIEQFRSFMLESANGDPLRRAKAITTTNFYIRAGGSMFSKKVQKHYADFVVPESNPFNEAGQLPEPSHRYVSKIDIGLLLSKAETDLREDYPASYIAFLLSLYCGMRRGEIDRLTWDQIDLNERFIWIRTTEYFTPKAKNSEDRIDMPILVTTALKEYRETNNWGVFVLPGPVPVAETVLRSKNSFRLLLTWLRLNGVDHIQALHTLRKEAGSLMFAQTGSIDQAASFLRNHPSVARAHYIGRKSRLELNMDSHTSSN